VRSTLASLPKRKADFIEPMDCAPVTKLADGPGWVFEILCGGPHKISVASAVMWRWEVHRQPGDARRNLRRHINPVRSFGSGEIRYGLIGKPSLIKFSPVWRLHDNLAQNFRSEKATSWSCESLPIARFVTLNFSIDRQSDVWSASFGTDQKI